MSQVLVFEGYPTGRKQIGDILRRVPNLAVTAHAGRGDEKRSPE